MRRMKRIGWFLMVVALSVPALAQECPCGRGPRAGRYGEGPRMGPRGGPGAGWWAACLSSPVLELTAQQRDRLAALRKEGREEAMRHRQEVRDLRHQLHQAMMDPKASPAELKARAKALHQAMDQHREQMVNRLIEARGVLTPEQIGRLADIPECQGPGFRGAPPWDFPPEEDQD